MKDDYKMTIRGPMHITFVSIGSDMIHFVGHPRKSSENPFSPRSGSRSKLILAEIEDGIGQTIAKVANTYSPNYKSDANPHNPI